MKAFCNLFGNRVKPILGNMILLLVNDRISQGCNDNEIASVVAVAEEGAAEGVLTFVIGVNDPPLPDAPNTVSISRKSAPAAAPEVHLLIQAPRHKRPRTSARW